MISEINLNGGSVVVTGGTGSFGQAFVRYVLKKYRPRRLIIFSRDEAKQHEMASVLTQEEHPSLRYFIGDVRDQARLEMAMQGVDVVVHAAALKVVPVAEYNPIECINTNVHGAENILRSAIRTGVSKVLMLSTDKAVSPINLYGATKLAGEKLMVAGNNLAGENGPRFAVARYGNVIGSRGSVVPLFTNLLARGVDHLPITDERMTRFWITLEQGVQFVLTSLGLMRGGEIFVPKLNSTRVTDLARAMAPELPHKIVGIRPGEKVHETLMSSDEARYALDLEDRYLIKPSWAVGDPRAPALAGKPVPEDFRYTSNNEDLVMSVEQLREMLSMALPKAA